MCLMSICVWSIFFFIFLAINSAEQHIKMEADVLNALESQLVYANGGRDRNNHILIVIQVPYTNQQNDANHISVVNQKQLDISIKYLLACFSDETKQSGFVIVFDAQKCSWRLAKSCVRYLNQILDKNLENFIVLRQDAFWDNKRVENCAKSYKKGEPNIISKSRLIKYFELSELPDELGGTLNYNHVHWIQNRMRIDEYKKVYDQLTIDYDNFHITLIDFKLNIITDTKKVPEIYYLRKDEMNKRIKYFIESGKKIIQDITNSAKPPKRIPQDLLDARDKIKLYQNEMKKRESQLYSLWIELEKTIDDARELVQLGEGVTIVTNWILGTAEQMFKEQHKVGYDVQTAEELRNQHEQLELQCWDTYGNYAKLLYKINQLNTLDSANMKLHKDLLSQRDFMDFVCRSFASRLERRRNVLITSLRFYRLVSEYFDRTNDVFKSLVMGSKVDDHDKACENLRKLKESQHNLDKIEKELSREGEKLSDMLSMPIKDALGREIDIDYSNDIINVRDILDATIARRNIFVDSLELQKLTLEQITHIHIYEKDAETTIKWIEDLYKVMTKSHTHVGCTVYEIQNQKDELQSFQETAKGTFDYGCQILSAALALRQLCNLSLDRHSEMSEKINKIYRNLQIVSQEQMTRLRVSAVFHRSVEEHCVKLRGLKESVQLIQDISDLEERRQILKKYLTCREQLMVEIGRMVRLGRLLKSRLKEAFFFDEEKGEGMNSPPSSHSSTVNSPINSEPGTSSSTVHETSSQNTLSTVAAEQSIVKNIIPFESNIIASDAISQKLSTVSKLAEELDNVIKGQQLICMDALDIETMENDKRSDELATVEDWNSCLKSSKSSMEDDSFVTASDVTCTPQSRSSSYHTASECRTSPWWDNEHNSFDADSLDLDSQLPSLNLFNSITLSNMPYDESDTSLQLLHQRKSPLLGSDSTDADENNKKVLLVSSSSNDELSTDSLSSSKELKHVNGIQNPNENSDNEILELPLDPNNNASHELCFTTKAEIHATDPDLQRHHHQSGDIYNIKVIEMEPKLTAIGVNLDEAIQMQKDHDDMLCQIQEQRTPLDELDKKIRQLVQKQNTRSEVLQAIQVSMELTWSDINKMLLERKFILDQNVNFYEKYEECIAKMLALEMSCRDTMIPIEIESVLEYLDKFKQLRTDVLTSVMVTLKEGSTLIDRLKRLIETGSVDSRPENVKIDGLKSITQIEVQLEELHDRRNALETAWQTRKTQLEQCYALAVLAKDIVELETLIEKRRTEILQTFSLGDSVTTTELLLKTYQSATEDAIHLRDRALKITKQTEQLVLTGCFAGDQASHKAYSILENATEYYNEIERREQLLEQSHEFYQKAEKALKKLEALEVEVSTLKLPPDSDAIIEIHKRVLSDLVGLIEEPVRLGNELMKATYQNPAESVGIKRTVEEMENRKIYLENVCSANRERNLQIQHALNIFWEKHNNILSWLVSIVEIFLRTTRNMGENAVEGQDFLNLHHQLLSDLEIKGSEINSILLTLPPILEYIEDSQRQDIDNKVEALHQHWTELKTLLENRIDLVQPFIQFHFDASKLLEMFEFAEEILRTTEDDEKLQKFEESWDRIKPIYTELKTIGNRFINDASKVADPYLEVKNSIFSVEDTLNQISNRQFDITENWENLTIKIVKKRETELIIERIMSENVKVLNATTKLDAQLYPVLNIPSNEPNEIQQHVEEKLENVLCEIEKAQQDIRTRINTINEASDNTDDDSVIQKLNQIRTNLTTVNSKLTTIKIEYKQLLDMTVNYLRQLNGLKENIETFFSRSTEFVSADNISNIFSDYNQFKEITMSEFRNLIDISNTLIDRIKEQEPHGSSEYDADRVISLLEGLRVKFETQNNKVSVDLEHKHVYEVYRRDYTEITRNLEDMKRQLVDVRKQFGESASAAKATSLAFEYFEHTIELLGKRIETLKSSGENVYKNNSPDLERSIKGDLDTLNRKWVEFLKSAKAIREMINRANTYFSLYETTDSHYREHSTFLFNTVNKLPQITSVEQAANLIESIDEYIKQHEQPHMDDLKTLSQLSYEIFNFDKTEQLRNDSRSLFQSYVKLKSDIGNIIVKFKTDENEKLQNEIDEIDKMIVRENQLKSETHVSTLITTVTNVTNVEKHQDINENGVITVISHEPPSFTHPLRNATIQEGDHFVFECIVTGVPEPKVEWFKDGISIQNNPDYKTTYNRGSCTLTIDETFAEDSASFTCKALNSVGTADTTATLTVRESNVTGLTPPQFTRYLMSGTAKEGESFEFMCTVTGNPLPELQWHKNDVCIDNSNDYVITYNNGEGKLRFEEVFLEDKAIYICKAVNPIGQVQCWASLDVEPLEPTELPVFKQPLSNIMARVGQKIKLECVVTGIPKPDVFWSHNGKSFNIRDSKLQYENEKAILVINEAFPKDSGIYIVIAKNLAGEASSACNVSVKGRLPNETSDSELASDMEPIKPNVQLPLKNLTATEGKPVRLDCIIVGQPEPEVIWYHNGRPVKESQDFQLLFQGDRCSLLIQEVFLEDAGRYRVVAINSAGEASSECNLSVIPLNEQEPATRSSQLNLAQQTRILPVETPPQFEKLLIDLLGREGETVEFECKVTGDPRPNIKWSLNNQVIEDNSPRYKQTHDNDGNAKLIINSVTPNDKGLYTVKAVNSSGEAKCFSHLIVKSVNVPNQTENENFVSPTFKELFTNKMVHENECTKFECNVIGRPMPKIKWYFNDQPINETDDKFLISANGEHQQLALPKVTSDLAGKISCIAENEAGKATCVAYLNIFAEAPSSNLDTQSIIEEHNTSVSNVTIKKQMFTTTSTSQVTSTNIENGIPQTIIHTTLSKQDASYQKQGDQTPEITESKQYQEYHQTDNLPTAVQQRSTVTITKNIMPNAIQPSKRKQIAPRFVSPFVGKIVDQGADIKFEAILDGFPSPEVTITKNGNDLFPSDSCKIDHSFNKVTVELKNVGIKDAGRYTCTAKNDAGSSISTADLVVKKSIFPPVFGRRLQAQVVKKGERVIMEVEITGTPEPTVTWYKDNRPLNEIMTSQYRVKQSGIGHTLIIEKATIQDFGKYMVRATNAGGEAQSIADFAVLEPTPERMVEVVKTVVFDDVKIPDSIQNTESKSKELELLKHIESSHISHQTVLSDSEPHANEESTIITETTRTTEATMRMEHKLTFPDLPETLSIPQKITDNSSQTPIVSTISEGTMFDSNLKTIATNTEQQTVKHDFTQTVHEAQTVRHDSTQTVQEKSVPPPLPPKPMKPIQLYETPPIENSTVDSESISKQVAFDFFMNKLKTSQLSDDEQHIPKYTKFENLQQTQQTPQQPPTVVDAHVSLEPIPVIEKSTITSSAELKSSFDSSSSSIQLEPGPPPEIGYMPIESNLQNHHEQKEEQQQQHHEVINITLGEPIYRPQAILKTHPIDVQDGGFRCPSPSRPSAEGIAMEKLWAHKPKLDFEPESHIETEATKPVLETKNLFETIATAEPKHDTQTTETFSSKSIQETKHMFESFQSSVSEPVLKAPMLVKSIELKKEEPLVVKKPPKSPINVLEELHLEPGTPPEVCYAPKPVLPTAPPVPPRENPQEAPPIPARPTYVQEKFQPHPPPVTPTKFIKSELTESDYESDHQTARPQSTASTPTQFSKPQYSGYMADTEDITTTKSTASSSYYQKSMYENSSFASPITVPPVQPPQIPFEKPTPTPPAKFYRHHIHKHDKKDESSGDYMKESSHSSTMMKNISMTSKHIKYNKELNLEPLPFTPDPPKPKQIMKCPPPPSPSKFIKGEFRESDYESDYEGRIAPVWRPYDSDSEPAYKPVKPNLTPTGRRSNFSDGAKSPTPPSEFDRPPQFEGPPRPKFEPIEIPKHTVKLDQILQPKPQPTVFKPKPIPAKPTKPEPSPPMKQVRYYTAIAGQPIHNTKSFATETSNTMHMKESTESSHRVVNITQTRRVIPLDGFMKTTSNHVETKLEPFPYEAQQTQYRQRQKLPPPPTPTKFVPGEFRESDYESEVESARIRPIWTPHPSETDEPKYRPVNPPRPSRASSLPRTNNYGRIVSPMEFDKTPPPVFIKSSSVSKENYGYDQSKSYHQHQTKTQTIDRYSTKKYHTLNLSEHNAKTQDDINIKPGSPPQYGYIQSAQHQMEDMNKTFKTKAQHFIQDITKPQKPILKKTVSDSGSGENHAYREESRVSQYGTKHIDPNTGLIYFKYDFGYEFGIIFPGEGKKFIAGGNQNINHIDSSHSKSIEPINSHRTHDIEIPVVNEKTSNYQYDREYQKRSHRFSLPIQLSVDEFHKTPNPNTNGFISTNGIGELKYSSPGLLGGSKIVNQAANEIPKRPPMFITPLKDIAVVSGQTARFECIVQCEPHPVTFWSKNGVKIDENQNHFIIEFRNGVCRLMIPHAFPGDAGTYSCTATNQIGSVTTSSELLVPGEKWGIRK